MEVFVAKLFGFHVRVEVGDRFKFRPQSYTFCFGQNSGPFLSMFAAKVLSHLRFRAVAIRRIQP